MAYTTSTIFILAYPHRATPGIATFPGTPEFAQMITDVSTDINDFLDETADISDSGDGDHQANVCIKVSNYLLEQKLIWIENLDKTPLSERSEIPEPDLMEPKYAGLREKLNNLRRKNKPVAMNFSMNTGRVTRS